MEDEEQSPDQPSADDAGVGRHGRALARELVDGPLLPPATVSALRLTIPPACQRMFSGVWAWVYRSVAPLDRRVLEPPVWVPIVEATSLFVELVTRAQPLDDDESLARIRELGADEAAAGHDLDALEPTREHAFVKGTLLLENAIHVLDLSSDTRRYLLRAVFAFNRHLSEQFLFGYAGHFGLAAEEIDAADHYRHLRREFLMGGTEELAERAEECGWPLPDRLGVIVTTLPAIDDVGTLMRELDTSVIGRNRGQFITIADAADLDDLAATVARHATALVVVSSPAAPQGVHGAHRLVSGTLRLARADIIRPTDDGIV